MKIALVHDYIKEYGGAERVLETLHELYPQAEVFTTLYLPQYLGPHRERFADWKIHTSSLQNIPYAAKLISPFRLLAPFAFRQFDFSKFDVVIVSATGAYMPNMIRTKSSVLPDTPFNKGGKGDLGGAIHICYCHTPPRYLYGYATAREWKKNIFMRILGETANYFLRMLDVKASKNVDYYIANSHEVAGRIKKFYHRDATVIYPPVEISNSEVPVSNKSVNSLIHKLTRNSKLETRNYFLAGGRLARPKHIDLIIRACREQNLPLKVFGKGFAGYGEELRELAGPETEFVGEVDDAEKLRLMAGAKAYLFASEDEDLGITPIEAMAVGTPVIAYRSGGVQETVVEGNPSASSGSATGIFFDELTVASLQNAITEFEKKEFDPQVAKDRAKCFSKERFKTEIQLFVEKVSR
jgi:glycosyltransferase involved in cell wall biosynthesis